MGQTLTAEVGDSGSRAVADVHDAGLDDLCRADETMAATALTEIAWLYARLNAPGALCPVARFEEDEDLQAGRAERDLKLTQGPPRPALHVRLLRAPLRPGGRRVRNRGRGRWPAWPALPGRSDRDHGGSGQAGGGLGGAAAFAEGADNSGRAGVEPADPDQADIETLVAASLPVTRAMEDMTRRVLDGRGGGRDARGPARGPGRAHRGRRRGRVRGDPGRRLAGGGSDRPLAGPPGRERWRQLDPTVELARPAAPRRPWPTGERKFRCRPKSSRPARGRSRQRLHRLRRGPDGPDGPDPAQLAEGLGRGGSLSARGRSDRGPSSRASAGRASGPGGWTPSSGPTSRAIRSAGTSRCRR